MWLVKEVKRKEWNELDKVVAEVEDCDVSPVEVFVFHQVMEAIGPKAAVPTFVVREPFLVKGSHLIIFADTEAGGTCSKAAK